MPSLVIVSSIFFNQNNPEFHLNFTAKDSEGTGWSLPIFFCESFKRACDLPRHNAALAFPTRSPQILEISRPYLRTHRVSAGMALAVTKNQAAVILLQLFLTNISTTHIEGTRIRKVTYHAHETISASLIPFYGKYCWQTWQTFLWSRQWSSEMTFLASHII